MAALRSENVHDYPRPPALEPVPQRLRVVLGEEVVADTTRGFRVLETHHAPTYYFPPKDIPGKLEPCRGQSFCEWKGRACYFDLIAAGKRASSAAWCFDNPSPDFRAIAGYVSFYAGRVDACFVGDVQVTPQPGSFYGGWITPNLLGVPKGAPGTEHW